MSGTARFGEAEDGDGRKEAVMAMMQAIKSTMSVFIAVDSDPRDAIALSITAAGMFAGAQWGTLLHMGEVTPQDTKRGAEMAARNFREGVKVGLAHAKRVEIEQYGAGSA